MKYENDKIQASFSLEPSLCCVMAIEIGSVGGYNGRSEMGEKWEYLPLDDIFWTPPASQLVPMTCHLYYSSASKFQTNAKMQMNIFSQYSSVDNTTLDTL